MEQEIDLRGYLAVVKRRFWLFLVPAIVVSASVAAIAFVLPRIYEAKATILVESQLIPTDLASPTVTANASERIQVIRQRVLTRDNLLQIAGKFNLYDYERGQLSPTRIVENMRESIAIQQIDVGGQLSRTQKRQLGVIGFTVSFEYRHSVVAARVTNELVSSILSQNIETRLTRASETSKFFKQQRVRIEQKLLALESKIAEFKRNNEEALPDTLVSRRQQLVVLTAQISELERRIQWGTSVSGKTTPDRSNADQIAFQIQAKEVQLESYRAQRGQLEPLAEKGFVPKNRIIDLDRQIVVAEIDINALKARMDATNGTPASNGDPLSAVKAFHESLVDQADALSKSIVKTPVVEVELNALNREYENLQAEYRQAQAKLDNALTGERLEQDRQSERFEVIEQATVPSEPTKPERGKIMLAGSFGGIGLGVGLVILLELLDNSVRSVGDLERRLQLRPIAVIPYINNSAETRRRKRRFWLFVMMLVIVIILSVVLVDRFYMPIDLLIEKIWNRIAALLPA